MLSFFVWNTSFFPIVVPMLFKYKKVRLQGRVLWKNKPSHPSQTNTCLNHPIAFKTPPGLNDPHKPMTTLSTTNHTVLARLCVSSCPGRHWWSPPACRAGCCAKVLAHTAAPLQYKKTRCRNATVSLGDVFRSVTFSWCFSQCPDQTSWAVLCGHCPVLHH